MPILLTIKILYCISEAFKVLRKNKITHRDVKPANLFLTRNDILMADIKLGDFTFAKSDPDL
ncbi:MAG: serine/threonine protein kinase, partial [Rhizobiales bacterium]|nr:serine/threonine protein kinase [Hyphomicrobiales bacterium]